LDLDTVVQATQKLSSKLKLSELLASLMNLIVINTGASKGVLLLTENYQDDGVVSLDRSQDTGESSIDNSDSSHEGSDPGQLFIRAKAKDTHATARTFGALSDVCGLCHRKMHHLNLVRARERSTGSTGHQGQDHEHRLQRRPQASAEPYSELLLAH
jgi:hypothetical protein